MEAVLTTLALAAFVVASPAGTALLDSAVGTYEGAIYVTQLDMVCVLVTVECALCIIVRRRIGLATLLGRPITTRAAAAGYVAGAGMSLFADAIPSELAFPYTAVSAMLSSAGFVALVLTWARRLSISLDELILCAAAVLGTAALASFAFAGLGEGLTVVFYAVSLIFGAGYLCAVPQRDVSSVGDAIGSEAMGLTDQQLRILLVPVGLGLMLLGFVLGVGGDQSVFGVEPWPLGSLVSALVVCVLAGARRTQLLDWLTGVCIPVAVLCLFVLCMFLSVNPSIGQATTLISYTIFGLVGIAGSALFVRLSHGRSFSVAPVALMCGVFFLSFLAGSLAARFITSELFGVALLAVSVLHAALMAAAPIYLRRIEGSSTSSDVVSTSTDRRESLSEMCVEAGLSERESEILSYIARGYGANHIAGELNLASSTARTHCNNIYRKLGVASREEAIELIERKTPGESL